MDTEAIAIEIVRIRGRLAELDDDVEADDVDADEERKQLHDRMRQLQDQLAPSSR